MYRVAEGVGLRVVPGGIAVGAVVGQHGFHLLDLGVPLGAVMGHRVAVGQVHHTQQRQRGRSQRRAARRAGIFHQQACQQQHVQHQRVARALAGAIHQHQRQKNDDRRDSGAALPEDEPPAPGIHSQADNYDGQQREQQQVIPTGAVCKIRRHCGKNRLHCTDELAGHILGCF